LYYEISLPALPYVRSCRISLCGHQQIFIPPQNNPEMLMYVGYAISKEFFVFIVLSHLSSET
jgi:hypothetical protein